VGLDRGRFCALALAFGNIVASRSAGKSGPRNDSGSDSAAVTGLLGALVFVLGPAMLIHSTLALSDPRHSCSLRWRCGRHRGQGKEPDHSIGCSSGRLRPLPLVVARSSYWPSYRCCWSCFGSFVGGVRGSRFSGFCGRFIGLVLASGGFPWRDREAHCVRNNAGDLRGRARRCAVAGSQSPVELGFRFVAHPWGPKSLSLPILALAVVGAVELVRRRVVRALPLATLAIVNLAVCLAFMDPADGARYALPSLPLVALAAVVGIDTLVASLTPHRRSQTRLW